MSMTHTVLLRLGEYAESIILALVGGGVSYLVRRQRSGKGFKIFEFVTGAVIGGFAGLIVSFLCQAAGMKANYSNFLVAMSGYMGGRLLDSLEHSTMKRLKGLTGDDLEDDDKKKDEDEKKKDDDSEDKNGKN